MLFATAMVVYAVVRGRVTWMLMLWAVYPFLVTIRNCKSGAWGSRKQWLLVPGGLVQRKSGLFKKDWEVHLFARAECVLIVRHAEKRVWRAHVADAYTNDESELTPREATMLLRAWLCPLPTPSEDRLTDLA